METKTYTAKLNNVRISPQKLRLVVNLVKELPVEQALVQLRFLNKKGGLFVTKVLESASASAKEIDNVKRSNLQISEIFVNAAPTYKRGIAVSKGRYHRILKRGSNITVKLTELTN